ncbi:MAG: hypothetical protein EBT74_06855, partial [Gammaproteobacteria bacterium]|nr:hypothetical protein [Gammaproteobacteria bacterium]
QKRLVQPFCPEDGAVAQFMMRGGEERPDRAMNKQRHDKPCPHLLREQIEGDAAACRPQTQMTERHEQPACIVGRHQAAQDFLVDGTSVPANLQRLADLAHRCQLHVLDRA